MWEAYGLGNEELLWAGTGLYGGLAGRQQGTCGAVASAVVCLGLRHRTSPYGSKEADAARKAVYDEAKELAGDFIKENGALACFDLIGVDLSDEAARKAAREGGLFERKCMSYIRSVIEKLYELEEKRGEAGKK